MNTKPNILFILSDQHSPHFLGYSGNPTVNTPNLDKLAEEGMVFDNAYCQNPLCVPSRSSLITGRYSRSIGIYHNNHILEANSPTIPRILGASGYRTCLIGKAHFNGEQFHGYQQRPYGDLFGQGHQPDPSRSAFTDSSGLGDFLGNTGPSGIPLPLTQTEICVAETAKWLQTHIGLHRDQPFFLSVHFDKPHFPIKPHPEYYHRYAGKVELPAFPNNYLQGAVPFVRETIMHSSIGKHYNKDADEHKRALAAYYGCVEWVDNAIGRLLQTLEYLGLAKNTVVIYASDHGEMAGELGAWQKTLFFEASARVPLLIRWPKRVRAGKRCSVPVGLIDLFPTLCEVAESAAPPTCEGMSLIPLLTDSGAFDRDAIYSETVLLRKPEHAGCMIRTGRWKYCYYLDGNEELYDLEKDRQEWNNLAQDPMQRDVVATLREKVIAFWKPDQFLQRYQKTPRMSREKHFYEFSNQFLLGDGSVADARP
jgi:choline-sulfatase